ncbi:hypothetical protein GJAV_G00113520 [Gymnothorax javanicus]|nr:hypothetical protein GJAV_G00113520 [Gymnothorax javanicus]
MMDNTLSDMDFLFPFDELDDEEFELDDGETGNTESLNSVDYKQVAKNYEELNLKTFAFSEHKFYEPESNIDPENNFFNSTSSYYLYRVWRYRPWNFGDLLCKLFQFVSESCTYSTILNITALSVERYFAICFPLKAKVVVTKERVKGVIIILWIVALFSAGPIFVLVGVEHESGTNPLETNECKATEYAISLIGRKLWKRKKETIGPNISSRDKNNKQTVKMLAVVVFAFVLCWLPFHVGRYLISKSSEAGSPLMSLIKVQDSGLQTFWSDAIPTQDCIRHEE